MEFVLDSEEIRVLGSLIEKEMATPEYYPLSLNSLLNACNQKSNREPVVVYDEETVLQAIDGLKARRLVIQIDLSRVVKYEERLIKDSNFKNQEAAVMCVLMLRGPQTAGEIRGRTERLYEFKDLEEVNSTLEGLIFSGHVMGLPRQPGRKEIRYCHLLSGQPEIADNTISEASIVSFKNPFIDPDRIVALEEKVESLTSQVEDLKKMFFVFRQQFE